jgi:predicted MFS family arabinose efflux permease
VAAVSVLMACLVVLQLGAARSAAFAALCFCLVALAAGVRMPASGGLGLEQLPEQPGAMMAARTAANQGGYLLGAVVGGAVIAAAGYGALGFVLAAGLAVSALLILRVDDPRAGKNDDRRRIAFLRPAAADCRTAVEGSSSEAA